MSRDMKVSVLVQMVDRLTAPLRGMTRTIRGIATGLAEIGRRIGIAGAAIGAISFASPIQQAAAWDAQLRDIAITAGKTGGEVEKMIGQISARYQKLALETGQRSEAISKGAQLLVAAGMEDTLIDRLLPSIARVATAANATMEDASKTAFALSETLRIRPEEMELALAKLVTAGKLGRFEFANMAKEFPGLTAQMAKLGVTGMEAVSFLGAALQTAMLGTDDPAQAANNLKNFLTKVNAPDAIKRFEKELKVDVVGVMADATAKGINPVEAVIQKLTEKMKVPKAEIDKIMKDAAKSGASPQEQEKAIRQRIEQLIQGSKVAKIYGDMQVLDFLIPMLLNVEKFKEMKRQIAAAGIDVIAEDFSSRLRGLSGQLAFFGEVGTQVMRRVGLAFASNLPAANRALTELLQWVERIDAKWPGLIDTVLSWTGAVLLAGAALAILTPVFSALGAAIAFVLFPLKLLWAALAGFLGGLGGALAASVTSVGGWGAAMALAMGRLAGIAGMLLASLAMLGRAFVSVGVAMLTTPLGWVILGLAAIAAGAAYVYQNWERIGPALRDAWNGVVQSISDAWAAIQQKGAELVEWGRSLPGRVSEAVSQLGGQLRAIGEQAIQGLWDGMKARFDALVGWLRERVAELGRIFSSVPSISNPGAPAQSGAPAVPGGTMDGFSPTSSSGSLGGSNGFTRAAANSNVAIGGRIVVEATDGTRIVNTQSTNPAVPVTPNRGAMLGRA